MGFYAYRVVILLVCIEYLVFQNEKVLAARSRDMVIHNKEQKYGVQGNDSPRELNNAMTNHYMKHKKSSALQNINIVHEEGQQGVLQRKNSRLLNDLSAEDMKVEKNSSTVSINDLSAEDMKVEKNSSTVSMKSEPYDSSKRRVQRGSDPIHNRS